MPEHDNNLHIHKVSPDNYQYNIDQKLLDLMKLASAPGLGSSNAAYRRIKKRVESEKTLQQKKVVTLKGFKLNGFDEHLFFASQQNEGILTQKVIEDYAKKEIKSDESRKAFLDYTKFRLGYLSYLGLLNDVTATNRFYKEKIVVLDGDKTKEHVVKMKVDYRYEVNSNFCNYLRQYRRNREAEIKEKFEFGRFDAYIYNLIEKNNGSINLDDIKSERLKQASDNVSRIIYQVRLMKELGYLEEKESDILAFSSSFKKRLGSEEEIYLNPVERKIVEFIKRHEVFTKESYRIDLEVEAENYAEILNNRLEKLIKLGLIKKCNDKYSFTHNGTEQLTAFYADSYEFTSFDRNILTGNKDGIIDLDEILAELEGRYSSVSASQTLERQKERLFIMESTGMVKKETNSIYSLTGKGSYIIDEENRLYTEEKRESLKQSFMYGKEDEEFYTLIKSRGGVINPEIEIKAILDGIDKEKGMYEVDAFNMIMRNYKCLGTSGIDINDETKLNVKLGYILQNNDGTLSLTLKGKNLVNTINSKKDDKRLKALSNKKFKLLNSIDKSCNKLDPKIYIKTQRIIADRELRRTVNLLRYKPEKLYLLGLLDKNEDGSYSINASIESSSVEYNHKKLQEELDSFNFSNVHKFIFKFCKNNEFNLEAYKQYAAKKQSGTSLERELKWKKSSCEKLTRVGYFENLDGNTYILTEKGVQKLHEIKNEEKIKKLKKDKSDKEKALKEFKPGSGYKQLLKYAKEGLLDFKDVEKRISSLPKPKQERELAIKKGMLNKLVATCYLEALNGVVVTLDNNKSKYDTGLFCLTDKAIQFINDKDEVNAAPDKVDIIEDIKNTTSIEKPEKTTPVYTEHEMIIKITKFDLDNIITPSMNGVLSKEEVEQSPKKSSVFKRINTLVNAGLLNKHDNGWKLTNELLDRAKGRENINMDHVKSHSKKHSLKFLTIEQNKLIEDMKDFLNLTGHQITKYIYNNNEVLFNSDIRYLLEKGILVKDKISDTYILTKEGTKFATGLTGDNNVFNSKLHSRREELKHDLLIYTAFKDTEKELIASGNTVLSVKTDRKLKSEDMKNNNTMRKVYPDLQIEYVNEATKEKGLINIEVDIGYSEKVIAKKTAGIPFLRWYTTSENQKEKVLKKARNMYVKIIDDEYWR